jgi:hypothetical protein
MLLLKLILVPGLIAVVTLATRRWGPRVGGLLMSMPVVAGPTLAFYAVEQGNTFAAEATKATLIGLVAVGAFCVSYARSAARWNWPLSLASGWLTFGAVTALLYRSQFSLFVSLVLAVVALLSARRLIPSSGAISASTARPAWDLPLRMAAAALLVFILTSLAERLGPSLSGVLTPFPIATAILAGFTHAQAGPVAVARFLRGFIPGLCTFAVFCFVLSPGLQSFSLPVAFGGALLVQVTLQGVILWSSLRAAPSNQRLHPTAGELSVSGLG